MNNGKAVIPPPLEPGSVIGIVAPSGNLRRRSSFEKGIQILHELGFRTKYPRDLWPGYDYMADTDKRRIREFRSMWNDSEVTGIMAARGGYGCLRIAEALAGDNFAGSPKRFIGFSDITLLHHTLNAGNDLVTFHGPVVTSLAQMSGSCLLSFKKMLMHSLSDWSFKADVEILRGSGTTRGITAGGNLSTVLSTLGTAQQPIWDDRILFLEDTGESPYKVDRMLTQLKLAGMLENPAAVILGDFSHGLGLGEIETIRHHEFIWKRVLELTGDAIPVWARFPIGHGSSNMTMPFGLQVTLDNGTAMLRR